MRYGLKIRTILDDSRFLISEAPSGADLVKIVARAGWSVICPVPGRREDAPGSTREHYNKRTAGQCSGASSVNTFPDNLDAEQRTERDRHESCSGRFRP